MVHWLTSYLRSNSLAIHIRTRADTQFPKESRKVGLSMRWRADLRRRQYRVVHQSLPQYGSSIKVFHIFILKYP